MADKTKQQRIQELIEKTWNQRGPSDVEKLLAGDDTSTATPTDVSSLEDIEALVSQYRDTFPNTELIIKEQLIEGNTVMTRVIACAKQDGEHKRFSLVGGGETHEFVLRHEFLNDKIVAVQAIPDIPYLGDANNLVVFIRTRLPWQVLKHAALILGLLINVCVLWAYVNSVSNRLVDDWVGIDSQRLAANRLSSELGSMSGDGRYVVFASQVNNLVDNYNSPLDWEQLRLYQQYEQVRRLAHRHLRIAVYYSQQYFSSLALTIAPALVAAICLLFISRSGWSNTNSYVITTFIVMTAISLLFGTLPNIYEYSRNIEANKRAYIRYAALENQILSYISTGYRFDDQENKTDHIPPREFILGLDKQLNLLLEFPLEMNPQAALDIDNLLNQLSPSTNDLAPTN